VIRSHARVLGDMERKQGWNQGRKLLSRQDRRWMVGQVVWGRDQRFPKPEEARMGGGPTKGRDVPTAGRK
jgi:hypothetical protein